MADDDGLPPQNTSTVPATLLALAKDSRYVRKGEDLLVAAVESMLPTRHSQQDVQAWASIVTTLLYGLLVTWRLEQTAGMAVCNLRFARISKCRIAAGILASSVLQILVVRFQKYCTSFSGRENLSGSERRRVFERQREAMRRRAQERDMVETVDSSRQRDTNTTTQSSPSQLFQHILRTCQSVVSAPSGFPGPHAVVASDPRGQELESLLLWVLRLHLAVYCWSDGGFPTLLHRLCFGRVVSKGKVTTRTDSTTTRMMGVAMAAYSGTVLVRIVLKHAVKLWVKRRRIEQRTEPQVDVALAEGMPLAVCGICGLPRRKPACSVHCGHVFCWDCLQRNTARACPMCRTPCEPRDIILLRNYDGIPRDR